MQNCLSIKAQFSYKFKQLGQAISDISGTLSDSIISLFERQWHKLTQLRSRLNEVKIFQRKLFKRIKIESVLRCKTPYLMLYQGNMHLGLHCLSFVFFMVKIYLKIFDIIQIEDGTQSEIQTQNMVENINL